MQQQRRLSVLLLLLLLGLITTQTQTQQLPGLVTEPRTCVPIVYGAPCVAEAARSPSPPSPHLDRPEHGLPTTPTPIDHQPFPPPSPPLPPPSPLLPPPLSPPSRSAAAAPSRLSLLLAILLLTAATLLAG
ncbi:acrosin-like [Triticum urartu]|uniref:acrosin-like n=1 Tax=Triticum urartu TaxID=4572 RepID=UPI0020431FFF|nr:acrosin-like [Triticum urartu]